MEQQWLRVYEADPSEKSGAWVPADTSGLTPADALAGDRPVWCAINDPTPENFTELAELLDLPHLAVHDTLRGNQRPKVTDYAHIRFVVLRPAALVNGEVRVGEVHLYASKKFFLSVNRGQGNPEAGPVPEAIESRLRSHARDLGTGTGALLFATIDDVTDDYGELVEDLEDAVDEIEEDLFAFKPNVPRRIYELIRDVTQLQRAIHPLPVAFGRIVEETKSHASPHHSVPQVHLHHIMDRVERIGAQVDALRDVLTSGMGLYSALQSQHQNEKMEQMTQAAYQQTVQAKKISAWAAILFTPTVIAGVYGMNFHTMPELSWHYGYPMAVGLMALAVVTLYAVFKKQRWL